ncbi:sulfite exporter TauE/SafE family protein [Brachybacterium sp. EF45031]|uniref:sulfite exporter TauE/SafE family protein n=1 Tax=Brachybacterium sillae TaxID=2810536 RepID=UPI00217D9F51|nr:sulfite exporter TauE/SafE family protein [Brachybacterium sillae]MCS6710480.1 sulfite exporter TauE/SafE family protein [Brachybacterium sillae]
MTVPIILTIAVLIGASAALYSSVGHGGGSGYLAIMALFALPATVMRPSALVLNIVVASIALVTFARHGNFSWRVFWPFAVTAIPLAYVGGTLHVPGIIHKPLLAAVLLFSAVQLVRRRPPVPEVTDADRRPPLAIALPAGALIGLLAGVTGVGGGIFLSPVLLFRGWAPVKTISGVAAAFILVNSVAGLAGQLSALHDVPWGALVWWVPAAVLGGLIGSRIGSRATDRRTIYRLLAAVLIVAAAKMLLTLGS